MCQGRSWLGEIRWLVWLLGVITVVSARASWSQTPDEMHSLYTGGHVFALRDLVGAKPAPALYRGAVSVSRNRIAEAENLLHGVIAAEPSSEDAYLAHDLLANLYQRNGMYRAALGELKAEQRMRPEAKDVASVVPLFELLGKSEDLRVLAHRHSLVPSADRTLPVRINGKHVSYGFDTGGGLSVMSESEARRVGLTLTKVSTKMGDSSGNGVSGFNIAMAKEISIAGVRLQNVAFLVFPDTNEPFVEMPPDEVNRGLIGLPVLVAIKTLRWHPNKDVELGFVSKPSGEPQNMLFHGSNPIVQVVSGGKVLEFSLDTGAVDTDLNPQFAKELPKLVLSGQKETHTITGIGGVSSNESILLDSVGFQIGGYAVKLKPAHVFVTRGLGGESPWAGNLGNDLLNQAHTVTLDFQTMSLRLD